MKNIALLSDCCILLECFIFISFKNFVSLYTLGLNYVLEAFFFIIDSFIPSTLCCLYGPTALEYLMNCKIEQSHIFLVKSFH